MAKCLGVEIEKVETVNKILITGEHGEPLIEALQDIKHHKPEVWKELSKVIQFSLWDGYKLHAFEPTE